MSSFEGTHSPDLQTSQNFAVDKRIALTCVVPNSKRVCFYPCHFRFRFLLGRIRHVLDDLGERCALHSNDERIGKEKSGQYAPDKTEQKRNKQDRSSHDYCRGRGH